MILSNILKNKQKKQYYRSSERTCLKPIIFLAFKIVK